MVTPQERRTIAFGLAVAGVAWLSLRGVPGGLQYLTTARTAIERSAMQLAHAEHLVKQAPQLTDGYRSAQQRRAVLAERTLHDCEGAVCVDDAQVAIEDALAELPISLDEVVASMDSVTQGSLRRVRLDLHFETDASGLTRALAALQQHPLRLEFSELRVEAADPGAIDGAERLRVGLSIGAWAAIGRL